MVTNAITIFRIICALSLILCPAFSTGFYFFYILGGFSDILDGMIARCLKTETEFGAQLDTAADILFTATVIIKTLWALSVPSWLILWILCIAVIKCFNIIIGTIVYRRFVCEHTLLNKICGILLFLIPLSFGRSSQKPVMMLTILTCFIATLAAVQEGYYVFIGKDIR